MACVFIFPLIFNETLELQGEDEEVTSNINVFNEEDKVGISSKSDSKDLDPNVQNDSYSLLQKKKEADDALAAKLNALLLENEKNYDTEGLSPEELLKYQENKMNDNLEFAKKEAALTKARHEGTINKNLNPESKRTFENSNEDLLIAKKVKEETKDSQK
jgi:hypothetical protein